MGTESKSKNSTFEISLIVGFILLVAAVVYVNIA